ncbi:MAG: SAM-dependent methyltransferase [Candidatus Latescibacteria bacterium]|nr:SAM-dependent methyltransferase [Candidatus Latescibacterota bacterium]
MLIPHRLGLFEHLTHKANLKHTRYGWLRLTPAYSVHLVANLLDSISLKDAVVLDPFCGTGTTALVCAERGIKADTTDINPFLTWLASTKTQMYNEKELETFRFISDQIRKTLCNGHIHQLFWIPSIHQIEKWWDEMTLRTLSYAFFLINQRKDDIPIPSIDLLKIVFCRVMIAHSSASFGHQSMSFKKKSDNNGLFEKTVEDIAVTWGKTCSDVYSAACSPIAIQPRVLLCDARQLVESLPRDYYTCVITSPPYPNRMSYIRELRPYMYWLGYLQDGREAGELDWKAIGGTWGCATSKVSKWEPELDRPLPYTGFAEIIENIAQKSPILARYVHKYFYDMVEHIEQVFAVLKSGGTINYIIGNSKFYDVLLPVEAIFASLFTKKGFENMSIKTIRKRTSKKELYEYIVSARKP